MPIPSLEDKLKTLDYHQGLVLYWTCKNLSYEDIAKRYGYQKSWCVWQMSYVYHKLGIDEKDPETGKSLAWQRRREVLRDEVCPAFTQLINDDLNRLDDFPLIEEGTIVEPPLETSIPRSETPIPQPVPQLEPPQIPIDHEPPPPEPPSDFYPPELYRAWLLVLEDERKDNEGDII